jgi:hypothetical protein
LSEAVDAAKAAGFCKGKMCMVDQIPSARAWALRHSNEVKGALGAYASALAGKVVSADDAVKSIGTALGLGNEAMQKRAKDAAKKAGLCKGSTCTKAQILSWAKTIGKRMPAKLGVVARMFALIPGAMSVTSVPTLMPTAVPTPVLTAEPSFVPSGVPTHSPALTKKLTGQIKNLQSKVSRVLNINAQLRDQIRAMSATKAG